MVSRVHSYSSAADHRGAGRARVVDLDARLLLGRAPAVVGQEDVVDVHLEVVALGAEEVAAGHPRQHPVAQQPGMVLELVRVDGHHHLFATVGLVVDPEVGGVVGTGEERLERRIWEGRRRLGAEGLHRGGPAGVVDRHRALQVGEDRPAGGGKGGRQAVLGAHVGGEVQAVGGGRLGVVADPADAERRLEAVEGRPLVGVQGGEELPGAVVVDEIARREDDRLVLRPVGAVVGEPGVGDGAVGVVGDDRVVGHALALELGLPAAERGLLAGRADQQDLEVDALAGLRGERAERDRRRQQRDQRYKERQARYPEPPHELSSWGPRPWRDRCIACEGRSV